MVGGTGAGAASRPPAGVTWWARRSAGVRRRAGPRDRLAARTAESGW